jgi:hypothetical protein
MITEINLSDHYMKDVVLLLSKLSRYKNNKSFEDLTREDIPNGVVKSGNSDLLHKCKSVQHLQKAFTKILQMAILWILRITMWNGS